MNLCPRAVWRTICSEVSIFVVITYQYSKLTYTLLLMLPEIVVYAGGSHFQPLSWSLRMKIALGAARGLAFLHSTEPKVIYRDFKTSNILLDTVCI